jgi:hypothetical protein
VKKKWYEKVASQNGSCCTSQGFHSSNSSKAPSYPWNSVSNTAGKDRSCFSSSDDFANKTCFINCDYTQQHYQPGQAQHCFCPGPASDKANRLCDYGCHQTWNPSRQVFPRNWRPNFLLHSSSSPSRITCIGPNSYQQRTSPSFQCTSPQSGPTPDSDPTPVRPARPVHK